MSAGLWSQFQRLIEEGLGERAMALRLKLLPATGWLLKFVQFINFR